MIRLIKMSGTWYGIETELDDQEVKNIKTSVYEGMPIVLCSDLEEIDGLLDINGVQMIDAE